MLNDDTDEMVEPTQLFEEVAIGLTTQNLANVEEFALEDHWRILGKRVLPTRKQLIRKPKLQMRFGNKKGMKIKFAKWL